MKLQARVSYFGQTKEDPYLWTMNKKSRNVLIEHFSDQHKPFDSIVLVGHTIPIETAPTEKGRAIYVDETELKKITKDTQG